MGALGDDRLGQARHRRLAGRLVGDALDQYQLRLALVSRLGLLGRFRLMPALVLVRRFGLMPAVVLGGLGLLRGGGLLVHLDLGDGLVHVVGVVHDLGILVLLGGGLVLDVGDRPVPLVVLVHGHGLLL